MALRIEARYRIVTDDFDAMDRASDALMNALLDAGVTDPDVAVSMTEAALEMWFELPVDNALEALAAAAQVLSHAFADAKLAVQGFNVAPAEPALIGGAADLHAEPVAAY